MHLELKKSRLTHWWVGEMGNIMAFYNILSGHELPKEQLKVVGYYDNGEEITPSTNYVVLITRDGVITAQGSFYPFEEAHELYLQFLIKANKKNTVIARRWQIVDEKKGLILADIIRNGKLEEEVEFDFTPDKKRNVMFFGTSKKLDAKVVLATFSRRDAGCLILAGVIDIVKADIKKSSFASGEMSQKRVKKVKKILNEVTNGEEIVIAR